MSTRHKSPQDWYREEKARAERARASPQDDAIAAAKREFTALLKTEAAARKRGRPPKSAAAQPGPAKPEPELVELEDADIELEAVAPEPVKAPPRAAKRDGRRRK